MSAAVFLPLVSNSSENQVAAHGDNFFGVAISSDDSGGGSLDLPPTPNNHTFVVDTAEYLDRYLARESLPDGRLTFTIPITAPVAPLSATAFDTGRLTVGGLDYMVGKKRLAYFSLLQLRIVVHSDTEKVYIVAHSRGGLFTRFALRQYPWLASMIAGYITISTPHHGINVADEMLANDFEIDLPIVQNVPDGVIRPLSPKGRSARRLQNPSGAM